MQPITCPAGIPEIVTFRTYQRIGTLAFASTAKSATLLDESLVKHGDHAGQSLIDPLVLPSGFTTTGLQIFIG